MSGSGGGNTWSGNATVVAGGCTLFRLTAPPPPPPPATGQLSVWTNYQNQIAVRVDGAAIGSLTTYFAGNPPACGQTGTLTISVAPGTHAVTGASGASTWNGTATVVAGQCTLFELNAPTGGGTATGQLSLWTNYPNQIALNVDGIPVGVTTSYFANSTPTCGQAGTVTVTLAAGSHVISGASGSVTWNGTTTVTAGQCTLFELKAPAPTATGQLSIWTNYANQISVGINGSPVGTLTSYFGSGPPACGQAGTLTVTLPAGSYAVAGQSGAVTWNGTATVTAGQCTLFELNAPAGGTGTGQLSIWTNYPNQIAVTVDGGAVGVTTSYFPTGTPTCGQSGTITLTLPAGVHSVGGTSGSLFWNSTTTVVAAQCSLYELRYP